eukprot:scaffold43674_cov68-Phaeocystis_antarctica.AAC.3
MPAPPAAAPGPQARRQTCGADPCRSGGKPTMHPPPESSARPVVCKLCGKCSGARAGQAGAGERECGGGPRLLLLEQRIIVARVARCSAESPQGSALVGRHAPPH